MVVCEPGIVAQPHPGTQIRERVITADPGTREGPTPGELHILFQETQETKTELVAERAKLKRVGALVLIQLR